MHFSFGRVPILNSPFTFCEFFSTTGSLVSVLFLPHYVRELGWYPGSHDCIPNEGFELVGLVNDNRISDSSCSFSAVEDNRLCGIVVVPRTFAIRWFTVAHLFLKTADMDNVLIKGLECVQFSSFSH